VLAVATLAVLLDLRVLLQSYLAALIGWSAVPIGSLALSLIHGITGGRWGVVLGAALAAGRRTLPFTALLFLPVLPALSLLYPWAQASWAGAETSKALYLNEGFFALRTGGYFALWIGLSWRLSRHSARPTPKPTAMAAVGLILYVLTASLAGVDWALSIEPEFNSAVYGLLFITHQLLGALAFAIVVTLLTRRASPSAGLGTLLLGGVITWMYLAFMQYLVIWSADLPHEIA
jgi:hypothetical protein